MAQPCRISFILVSALSLGRLAYETVKSNYLLLIALLD